MFRPITNAHDTSVLCIEESAVDAELGGRQQSFYPILMVGWDIFGVPLPM